MDVFGSREGDPLLQDDPLAPSDGEAEEASDSAPQSDEAAESPSSSEQREEEGDTVFDAAQRTSAAAESEDESTRVIVRSAEAAAEGRLTELNAAFEKGWRLDYVDLRPETAEADSPGSHTLAFVLRDGTRAEDAV